MRSGAFRALVILLYLLLHSLAVADESEPEIMSLAQYKPVYFIAGQPLAKVQASFKIKLVTTVPLYFGYTQLMLLDLAAQPNPSFEDINYNPEPFYRFAIQDSDYKWIDVSPFEHESNGKGNTPDERAWDRAYVRYHTRTLLGDRPKLYWNFKAWVPVDKNQNNRDITQYRGLWEIDVTAADFMGMFFARGDFEFRFYPGGSTSMNPFLGGQELTFRAKCLETAIVPSLVAQLFHGYGENLLDMRENKFGFRVGLGL
jgi:outer membrane phospholipase A